MTVVPTWVESLREQQVYAIQNILEQFHAGSNIVMLDAPTGSGKTLIGEMVRRNLGCRGLYLCTSISLQQQFCKDFPEAALLKGRSNYATADDPGKFPNLHAGDCVKERTGFFPACYACNPTDTPPSNNLHCRWCHPVTACPYEEAKFDAIRSDLVCTNTSYFLHEANYVGSLPRARKLIVIDEADTLEDALMGFVGVTITPQRAKELNIGPPAKKTVESSWVEWAKSSLETVSGIRVTGNTVRDIRRRNYVAGLKANLTRLCDADSGIQSGGWVYTGYAEGNIQFKPVQVSDIARDFLWRHCSRFLLMSATTISFDAMAENLGFQE